MIIRVHHPDGTIREFPLQAPRELRFGSHPSLEIALDGARVSKLHGGFVFKEGQPCVVAAKPTEQITLNGKAVTRARIRAGDRIRVGDFELEICQPNSPPTKSKGGATPIAAAKQQDDLGLAAEPDELGLAPEPSAKPAESQPVPAAELDEMELLEEAPQLAETEDLEILDDFEELTEAADSAASAAPSSTDLVEESDDVEALDDMEMLSEAAENASAADADWLQSGELLAEAPAAAGDLAGGDLFGDLTNLPGTATTGSMPGTAAQAETAPKTEKQPRVKRKRNFGPLKYVAVALAGIGLLAAVVAASLLSPSPRDQFAAANQLYEHKQLADAARAFADFEQEYPHSIYTDEARVKRGMIKLLPLVDSQADVTTRFSTVQQVMRELDDLAAHPLVQEQLGIILPPLTRGLAEEALAMPVTAGLEKRGEALSVANQALQTTRQSLSPVAFAGQDLGDLEIRLFLLDREISETQDLEIATAEIEKSLESGQFAAGFAAYERLLDDHAAIANAPVLLNLMQRLSDGMAGQVAFSREALPPHDAPPFKPLPAIAFAWQEKAAGADGPLPVCVFDSSAACVYCLDAGGGALLWRKFIGFDAAFDPQVANAQAAEIVLHNAASGTIERLDGKTGEAVWSKPIDGKMIWIAGGKSSLFASSAAGAAWEFDMASGEPRRKITFPEPPGFAAYVDESGEKLYQPAAAASLFAVALDHDKCDGASFVGHATGAFRFAPADLGDYLAVVEDAGLDRSTLKLIAKQGRSQLIQTIPLDARAAGGPLAEQKLLLLPTDDGRLLVFGIDDQNSSQPMSLRSEVKWAGAQTPVGQTVWLKNIDGMIYQAGNGLQVFKRRAGTNEYILGDELFAGMKLIQPVENAGGSIVVAYRDRNGITVEGLNAQSLSSVWKTRVACSLLENAANSHSIDSENGFVVSADVARFPLTKPQLSSTRNIVVNLPATVRSALSAEPHLTSSPGNDSQVVAAVGYPHLFLFSAAEATSKEIRLPHRVGGRLAATDPAAAVPLEDGRVILVDWKTGAIVGKPFLERSRAGNWISTCSLDENRFAAASSDGNLQIYQLDHSPSWQIELLAERKLAKPPTGEIVANDKLLWMVGDHRTLTGLDANNLEERVAVDLNGRSVFGPRLIANNLIVATQRQIICLAAASGELVWQQPSAGRRIVGAETVGNDRLILASAAGEIWSADLQTGESSSKPFETGEAIRSIYAVDAGTVYLQTVDGSILLMKSSELIAKE